MKILAKWTPQWKYFNFKSMYWNVLFRQSLVEFRIYLTCKYRFYYIYSMQRSVKWQRNVFFSLLFCTIHIYFRRLINIWFVCYVFILFGKKIIENKKRRYNTHHITMYRDFFRFFSPSKQQKKIHIWLEV